jgi:hypothetical protein
MRDEERLNALLLVLAIGWIYRLVTGCKDFCSLRWIHVQGIKMRLNASDPRTTESTS